jgi:hypothetical protein
MLTDICWEILKEGDRLEDLGADGRTIPCIKSVINMMKELD